MFSNHCNINLVKPTAGSIIKQAEKAGYNLWEEDLIIERGESVMVLVEMEKL